MANSLSRAGQHDARTKDEKYICRPCQPTNQPAGGGDPRLEEGVKSAQMSAKPSKITSKNTQGRACDHGHHRAHKAGTPVVCPCYMPSTSRAYYSHPAIKGCLFTNKRRRATLDSMDLDVSIVPHQRGIYQLFTVLQNRRGRRRGWLLSRTLAAARRGHTGKRARRASRACCDGQLT